MYKPTNEYVFDRVYDEIKHLVVSCHVAEGERLNIEKLALQFDVSTSPVREVLNRLVAENLIDMFPKVGFFTKHTSETDIRDLLELNGLLLGRSLEQAHKNQAVTNLTMPPLFPDFIDNTQLAEKLSAGQLAITTGNFFTFIARQSDNLQFIHIIQHINDRLYYLRLLEDEFTGTSMAEISALYELFQQNRFRKLQDALKTYHDRRTALLPQLIMHLRLKGGK